jgi:hypothetical protein
MRLNFWTLFLVFSNFSSMLARMDSRSLSLSQPRKPKTVMTIPTNAPMMEAVWLSR